MRILDTDNGGTALQALDDMAQFGAIGNGGNDPGAAFDRALAVQLEIWFPWIGTDDPADGADVVEQLAAIHADLTGNAENVEC
jgi:hypothetical protein